MLIRWAYRQEVPIYYFLLYKMVGILCIGFEVKAVEVWIATLNSRDEGSFSKQEVSELKGRKRGLRRQ
jgi:hypothetical protein